MPYTIEQNILNQGSLAGRYALTDLSNTGKFSGYINRLPIRREIECTYDGASTTFRITVAEGSTFTVPNKVTVTDSGERDCLYVRASKEYSLPITFNKGAKGDALDASRFVYVVYDCDADMLTACIGKEDYPAESPFVHYIITDLQHLNVSFAYYTTTLGEHKCSLPIGYFDGALNWHAFDAFGFVDSTFWVEEDVQGLFPVGRDTASNYKNRVVDNTWLTFTKFTTSDAKAIPTGAKCLMLKKSGKVEAVINYDTRDTFTDITGDDEPGYYLALDTNLMYRKINLTEPVVELVDGYVFLCDFTSDAKNRFTSLSHVNTYKTQDIVGFQRKVDELKDIVASLNVTETLDTLQEKVDELTGLVNTIQGDDFIEAVEGVFSMQADIDELSDKMADLETELQEKLTEVNNVLETVQGSALLSDVSTLKRNVTELSSKISTLQTAGVNTSRSIQDLQTSVGTLVDKVDALENASGSAGEIQLQVATLQETVSGHTQSITSILSEVDTLESRVNIMQTTVSQTKDACDQNTADIQQLKDDVGDLAANFEEFAEEGMASIEELENRVSAVELDYPDYANGEKRELEKEYEAEQNGWVLFYTNIYVDPSKNGGEATVQMRGRIEDTKVYFNDVWSKVGEVSRGNSALIKVQKGQKYGLYTENAPQAVESFRIEYVHKFFPCLKAETASE